MTMGRLARAVKEYPVLVLGEDGVEDLCGDGSVLKTVKKAARARHVDYPVDGDEVTCHKRGWLSADPGKESEFENSRECRQPFKFLVGGGGAPPGLSDAAMSMKRGEHAYFWIAAHKGLGAEGNPPKIPENADLCYEMELVKFTDGRDVSPQQDGSASVRRVKKGATRPRGFLSPHDKSTVTFDYELWVSGTDDRPLDRPLANVGAVWFAREREKKAGYPRGLRVVLESVFQNDLMHVVFRNQACEDYEGVAPLPEGGTLECLVRLRSWHEFVECEEAAPGAVLKEISKFAGATTKNQPNHSDEVIVRGSVRVAHVTNTYACEYGDIVDIRDPRIAGKAEDEKTSWVKAAPSTRWMLDEDDRGSSGPENGDDGELGDAPSRTVVSRSYVKRESMASVQGCAAMSGERDPRDAPPSQSFPGAGGTPVGAFDDSEPFKPLCRGIDVAVRSMRLGERCRVHIRADYGYHPTDPGVDERIPRVATNADLVADLELFDLRKLPEMWEIRNRAKLDHCDEFKKLGNRRFKAGDYARAIRRYDRAVSVGTSDTYVTDDELAELRGKKVGVLLNRAAAHLKLKNYLECRNDARAVLDKDPNSLKALFRHGHASMHLDDLDVARASLTRVLLIDPTNRRAALDLELVDEKENRDAAKKKELFGGFMDDKE